MKDRQIQIISLLLIIILGLAGALLVQDLKRNPSVTGNQNENAVNTPKETTLFFAGDIMLSRNVAGRMISSNDYTYPFRNIAEKVKEYNIAFANLESPFSQEGPYFVEGTLVFNADPKAVQG
ncbi:MAG TPA: CapA family protein, partial [Candidatus Binatia bacterium]|nr:CapA family protein [Candidatus Binatia bacterium]